MTVLSSLPDRRAATAPSGSCLTDDVTTLDNEAFLEAVRRAAGTMWSLGVRRGDVVAVVLPNRIELVVTLFAAWRLGATVTPVNPRFTQTEIRAQLDDAGASVVVGETTTPHVTLDVDELRSAVGPEFEPVDVTADDLALLLYTSGSTGQPKGVMLDHGNIDAMCRMIVGALELDERDVSLLVLPLFHVNGIVVSVLSPLLAGGATHIAGLFDPATFFPLVERTRPTYFSAVPTIYATLLAQPDTHDTSSLRVAICGAAPMPAERIRAFEDRFAIPVVEGYGLSEGTCASTINPLHGPRRPGTVGIALPGQRLRVVDPNGDDVPAGEEGEVLIAGPNVMRGYLGMPEETERTIVDGWLRTGDVGRIDADGYLVLVDRLKDIIIRGGENLYPKEIENALHAHVDVTDAAVVGVAHELLGEVPVAFVTVRPGSDVAADELEARCRERIASVKVPSRIIIVDALPKNPVGKIDKPALRRVAAPVG